MYITLFPPEVHRYRGVLYFFSEGIQLLTPPSISAVKPHLLKEASEPGRENYYYSTSLLCNFSKCKIHTTLYLEIQMIYRGKRDDGGIVCKTSKAQVEDVGQLVV